MIHNRDEYFGIPASWNYMEARHGKGPCDPTGGVAKRNADMAVRHQKAVIQYAKDFYAWAKNANSAIDYSFLTKYVYERSKNFLTNACGKIITIDGTMKIHAVVKSTYKNMIWVRPMSCYNSRCSGLAGFKYEPFCQGWEEVSLLAVKTKIMSEPSC